MKRSIRKLAYTRRWYRHSRWAHQDVEDRRRQWEVRASLAQSAAVRDLHENAADRDPRGLVRCVVLGPTRGRFGKEQFGYARSVSEDPASAPTDRVGTQPPQSM